MYNNNVKKLPDAYYKKENGNNYKLLQLNELSAQILDKDLTDVLNCLDIEQATGATLDLYGQMLEKKRGAWNDYQYRLALKNKIGENTGQGDFNSVLELLAQMCDCDVKDIIIREVATNKIEIRRISLETLTKAGLTSEQFIEMVERILPVCVKVDSANIEGTFEFDDISSEYDANKGFGNIEQTIGGYFGLISSKGGEI